MLLRRVASSEASVLVMFSFRMVSWSMTLSIRRRLSGSTTNTFHCALSKGVYGGSACTITYISSGYMSYRSEYYLKFLSVYEWQIEPSQLTVALGFNDGHDHIEVLQGMRYNRRMRAEQREEDD
jgi:hypothetical protein